MPDAIVKELHYSVHETPAYLAWIPYLNRHFDRHFKNTGVGVITPAEKELWIPTEKIGSITLLPVEEGPATENEDCQ